MVLCLGNPPFMVGTCVRRYTQEIHEPGIMPKLRHIEGTGTARFITLTFYRRHRYLPDPVSRQAVLNELSRLRLQHKVKILGYVIMPEHVHLVLDPPESAELGILLGRTKARSAHAILSAIRTGSCRNRLLVRADGRPAVWERRCYDHNCRNTPAVIEKIRYCHNNPVARGLVSEPGDWPWSSYNWYHGRRESDFEIDGVEL